MLKLGKQATATYNKYKARAKAKINRLKKKGLDPTPYIDFDLGKPNFSSRKEYNEFKRKVDNFTNRNNPDFKVKKTKSGVPYLGIEKKILKQATQAAIKRAEQRLDEIGKKKVLDKQGNVVTTIDEEQQMLKEPYKNILNIPKDMDIEDIPNRRVLTERIKQMQKRDDDNFFRERDEKSRNNFIDILRTTHGEDADGVIKEILKLPVDDFTDFYYQHGEFRHNWWYKTIESIEHLGELEETIRNFAKANKDLKAFR